MLARPRGRPSSEICKRTTASNHFSIGAASPYSFSGIFTVIPIPMIRIRSIYRNLESLVLLPIYCALLHDDIRTSALQTTNTSNL